MKQHPHAECHAFLRRLPIGMVLALVLWLLLRGGLDVVTAAGSGLLVRSFEYPRVTRLVSQDHLVQVHRADFRTTSTIPTIPLTPIHFNTIVMLTLCLALPRPWSRRQLERTFMCWCLLLLSQMLNLVFHVKFLYASALGSWSADHYAAVARNFYAFGQYFTDLPGRFSFPFLVWLGFNWDHVMALVFGPGTERQAMPRSKQPGSRRKSR